MAVEVGHISCSERSRAARDRSQENGRGQDLGSCAGGEGETVSGARVDFKAALPEGGVKVVVSIFKFKFK